MTDPAPPRPQPGPERPSDNLRGAAWLIADMGLNIWALGIVKAVGADYPSVQIVFLRVVVGLVVILPWVWRDRGLLGQVADWPLQGLRVALSALTLAASFYAIARVPFAVFSAINFTRPILLMVLAALLLSERITPRRWVAAGVALIGALIAASPGTIAASWGLAALVLAVTTGTLAVIVTRRLKGAPEVVMMLIYTGGIGLVMAPFALAFWEPVAPAHWPFLIVVGVAAQGAQLCFIRAHWLGEAGVLAPVSYLSLVLSTAAGFLFFAEVPGWPLLAGAVLILAANLAVTRAR